jgi:hypothetical protein
MSLESLLEEVASVREAIRSSTNPEKLNVETRMDVSARHVSAAWLGVELFGNPQWLAVSADEATVQTGALLLVFGSGKASVDPCATALLRWSGVLPREGREHDFRDLQRLAADGTVSLSGSQRRWFDAVETSPEGRELLDFRHAIIHRIVRQDVAVGGSSMVMIAPSTGAPGTEDGHNVLTRAASFVEQRWKQFWSSLV